MSSRVPSLDHPSGMPASGRDLHDHAATGPLRQAVAGVDEQAVEPRVEPLRVTDGSDVQPRREKRLLDRIFRGFEITGSAGERSEDLWRQVAQQVLESGLNVQRALPTCSKNPSISLKFEGA